MARRVKVELVGDARSLNRAFASAGISANRFSRTTSRMRGVAVGALKGVAVGGVLALGIALKSSVSKAAEFQQTMNVLKEVSGATGKQMSQLSRLSVALGNDMTLPATSAKDAGLAMTELAKAGLNVRQVMGAAKGTLQLAAAAQIDEATAATITARALNAFGLAGGKATMVADILAATANSATGDIEDFALGFQQSSAVAHQAGLSLADTATALGELSNAGVVGADAGTSLKTMLQRLLPQTEKQAKAMEKLGVTAKDAQGNFLPIRAVIGQYHDALMKLTPAQRQSTLYTIFGSDAIRAANIILGQGVEKFDQMHRAVTKQGAAARMARAQTKGFKGALDAFKSTLETLEITIGLKLLPMLEKYTRRANAWLNQARNQRKIIHAVMVAVKVLVISLKVLAFTTNVVVKGVRSFIQIYRNLRATIERFYKWVRVKGLQIALAIVEPFSHLPRWLGGGWAQDAKATLQKELSQVTGQPVEAPASAAKGSAKTTRAGLVRRPSPDSVALLKAGGGKTEHHTHVHIDGREVAKVTEKHTKRKNRRSAVQTRGGTAGLQGAMG